MAAHLKDYLRRKKLTLEEWLRYRSIVDNASFEKQLQAEHLNVSDETRRNVERVLRAWKREASRPATKPTAKPKTKSKKTRTKRDSSAQPVETTPDSGVFVPTEPSGSASTG